jgi:hypothetical protein
MLIKLKKEIIDKYAFSPPGAGDMNTMLCIAIEMKNLEPVTYKDAVEGKINVHVFTFDSSEIEQEFKVIDHINPIPQDKYNIFKNLFEEIK